MSKALDPSPKKKIQMIKKKRKKSSLEINKFKWKHLWGTISYLLNQLSDFLFKTVTRKTETLTVNPIPSSPDYCSAAGTGPRRLPASYSSPQPETCIRVLGLHTEAPQTARLKQQILISLQFWRPQVQGQGVSRIDFCGGLSPWLVGDRLTPASSRGRLWPRVCFIPS